MAWVSRVRRWSSSGAMNTWHFPASRRKARLCWMRSRSRSKQVRNRSGSSATTRWPAPIARVAPGARTLSSAASRSSSDGMLRPRGPTSTGAWATTSPPSPCRPRGPAGTSPAGWMLLTMGPTLGTRCDTSAAIGSEASPLVTPSTPPGDRPGSRGAVRRTPVSLAVMSGFVDECGLTCGAATAGPVQCPSAARPTCRGRSRRRRRRRGRRRLAGRRPQRGLAARLPRPSAPPGQDGGHGQGKKKHGRGGADLEVPVPEGTVGEATATGAVLADLVHEGDRWLAAQGGQGGRGNARFLSNRRRAPSLRRAGRGGRGAVAAPRAQADGRRGAGRVPQRRQVAR